VAPEPARALAPEAEPTARIVEEVVEQAQAALADREEADGLLLRGFSGPVDLPPVAERYGLRMSAVAGYPMYRGIASLVGMDVLPRAGTPEEACEVVEGAWGEYDAFFVHHKDPDKAGEDGDRAAKVRAIEAFDAVLPRLRALGPAVIAVTGDHATPSQLSGHAWHPVPLLLWNGLERDEQGRFGERWCRSGAIGRRRGIEIMPLMLAMAGRLSKFGA
jgi:2,3-bisphosphoglycerate-independent phosphoglycerate mutase